jgi:hypothetical protein
MSNLAFVDFIFGTRRTGYAWGVFQDRWGGKEIAAGCARSKREARNNIKQAIRKAKTRYENRKSKFEIGKSKASFAPGRTLCRVGEVVA